MDARWWAVVVLAALPSLGAGGENPEAPPESWTQLWFFRFLVNAAGYASFMVPGYLLVQYFRRKNYLETGRGLCFPLVKTCVFGNEPKATDEVPLAPRPEPTETSPTWQALKLLFCAAGLQVSYLTWGVLQERVMTRSYGATATSPGERFSDSQFLVLMNRVLALIVAGLYCILCKQPRHGAPMYRYSFASLSNVLSSWCQYEALKFVSFPTQVLAKASKVIPVMLMGKLVSRRSYEHWEYLTAGLISIGVSMFLLSSGPEPHSSPATTLSGLILLSGYIAFDSFTSNWQDALFAYKMSSVQMMFGVNLFSCLFTVGSLLEQGALLEGIRFMGRYGEFAAHTLLLSICSACGQLFIFYTIGQFGAAVFTIIMTLRQAFAILLSCLLYGHTVTVVGGLGVAVVFAALLLRVYARGRLKQRGKKAVPVESSVQKV
ncbi:Adenosine 3'-phospho 5'-phosphosulfate transporter 1 [Camelus dromedarius]|uniref:Adenosine 3'-phospho 5'-phosphosulfate transporter 1 n=6 Tax=Camelus TaxID=9836 RepID=A0A5N4CSQ2_CAMDR|nr:adenosine 3'-phospho 5'-phosphosulfate transporter 1 [Camelus bactrianus]XP_031290472.1 adenosine 3'-phospho 5'-phosphosulfate transporter 1 isoform X1 [Camelus dromedarius]XP_032319067.1 adenosine 3'-phospho 5'-phosphosulfate transporter 1 isoform X1 [Camelus ferus]KAB1261865.1 Adenosine 3'-phospho 5'-phosphosulfate transporter 1 [Camelus dromedarius]